MQIQNSDDERCDDNLADKRMYYKEIKKSAYIIEKNTD